MDKNVWGVYFAGLPVQKSDQVNNLEKVRLQTWIAKLLLSFEVEALLDRSHGMYIILFTENSPPLRTQKSLQKRR